MIERSAREIHRGTRVTGRFANEVPYVRLVTTYRFGGYFVVFSIAVISPSA